MSKNPLAEVFGFPVNNMSREAINHRQGRLCPYHNPSGLNCTKSSATDPLGVCSIFDGDRLVITCPVRLRQDLLILADAAQFFFPGKRYVALTEARLKEGSGKSAGNIDIVLAQLDGDAKIVDFGAIEVQAVYISGNVRKVFTEYMQHPATNYAMEWPGKNYPNPDYLSSSRKRLVPQLVFKGGILHAWGKKMAVAVHQGFFERLPSMQEVDEREAEIVWLVYDLAYNSTTNRYHLHRSAIRYTKFENALAAIATPTVGDVSDFITYLEERIKKERISAQPVASSVEPTVEPLPDSLDESVNEMADDGRDKES